MLEIVINPKRLWPIIILVTILVVAMAFWGDGAWELIDQLFLKDSQ
jgi:hypothetical protein